MMMMMVVVLVKIMEMIMAMTTMVIKATVMLVMRMHKVQAGWHPAHVKDAGASFLLEANSKFNRERHEQSQARDALRGHT
jgi:hypothetical protein